MNSNKIYKLYLLIILVSGIVFVLYFLFKEPKIIKKVHTGYVQHEVFDSAEVEYYSQLCSNKSNVNIFISPEGNDNNVGTIKKPLATPEKARDIIHLLKSYYRNNFKHYTVIFLKGKYFINTSLCLNRQDSGNKNYPIVYKGEKGQQVVLTGGKSINPKYVKSASAGMPGWGKLNVKARNKIRMINLKALGITNYGYFHRRGFALPLKPVPLELFINDTAMCIARWPNEKFVSTGEVKDSVMFKFLNNHIKRWVNEPDAWAHGFWRWGWADCSLPIKSIDTVNYTITLGMNLPNYEMKKGKQWFAFNLLSELDTAGEYYMERQTGWLYFIPPSNSGTKKNNISVSIFGGENKPILEMDSARYITFKNIKFEDTRSAGIKIKNGNNIKIQNCTIKNIGTYGINLGGKNCRLENLNIYNIGAYAVSVKGGDRKTLSRADNVMENCYVHSFGRINFTYSPGVRLSGVGNCVKNCEIYNSPGGAVQFSGNYNIIEKNNIHDVCRLIDDGGAIYCGRDWALRGNIIRYNFIHNLIGSRFVKYNKGINGIYLDDCASGITVYGNILYKIMTWGIENGGGRDNIFENNIIVKCRGANYVDQRGFKYYPVPSKSILLKKIEKLNYDHPPWSTAFPKLADIFAGGYKNALNPGGCILKDNIGWKNKQWLYDSKLGKPEGFLFYEIKNNLSNVNPHFINENKLNLDLEDNSPAYSLPGFKRIPFEEIGVQNLKSVHFPAIEKN